MQLSSTTWFKKWSSKRTKKSNTYGCWNNRVGNLTRDHDAADSFEVLPLRSWDHIPSCEPFNSGQRTAIRGPYWELKPTTNLLLTINSFIIRLSSFTQYYYSRKLAQEAKVTNNVNVQEFPQVIYGNTRLLNSPSFHKHENQCPERQQSHPLMMWSRDKI